MNDIHPSAKHPDLTLIDSWIVADETVNDTTPKYKHILLKKQEDLNPDFLDELYKYIDHAHDGARQSLRAPLSDSLHPFHQGTKVDPAFGYPWKFGDVALQGFFGEIMAGIIAEFFASNGKYKWEVPVYLFRTYIVAFQQLEQMKQTDDWDRQIVGRTGDDGLAFSRDKNGVIVAWLACEAKCTRDHSSTLITENHNKLSQSINRPVDLLRVIDALNDYNNDDYSQSWEKSLRDYYWLGSSSKTQPIRYDLSMYVCGRCPVRKKTWTPTTTPHKSYKGRRYLISAEFHLEDLNEFINSLYKRMDTSS